MILFYTTISISYSKILYSSYRETKSSDPIAVIAPTAYSCFHAIWGELLLLVTEKKGDSTPYAFPPFLDDFAFAFLLFFLAIS